MPAPTYQEILGILENERELQGLCLDSPLERRTLARVLSTRFQKADRRAMNPAHTHKAPLGARCACGALHSKRSGAWVLGPDTAIRAALSYAKTHWGRRGKGKMRELEAVDVCDAELVTLGVLREIVYETEKGSDKQPVEYEHEFARRSPPILAYCRKSQKLVIAGGGYKVTWRGIVG